MREALLTSCLVGSGELERPFRACLLPELMRASLDALGHGRTGVALVRW